MTNNKTPPPADDGLAARMLDKHWPLTEDEREQCGTRLRQQAAEIAAKDAALEKIASGEAFREQRFAEDDDAEYFLRAQRNVQKLARATLQDKETGA
jgi:hypothetical protein